MDRFYFLHAFHDDLITGTDEPDYYMKRSTTIRSKINYTGENEDTIALRFKLFRQLTDEEVESMPEAIRTYDIITQEESQEAYEWHKKVCLPDCTWVGRADMFSVGTIFPERDGDAIFSYGHDRFVPQVADVQEG